MNPPVARTASPAPRILVIDDEPQIQRLLTLTLEAAGYRVQTADRGQEGLLLAAQQPPALILLDLGLPDLPGREVLRRLRDWTPVPVVILSVQDDEAGKIAALDSGADDYVTKPFHSGELLARVRVALRHAQPATPTPVCQWDGLVIDLATRRVQRDGRDIPLTATEYSLLALLVRHAGRVLTHRQILREVWGPAAETQTHYLRVYIARLREKLEVDPANPTLFLTEPGIGYRVQEPRRPGDT